MWRIPGSATTPNLLAKFANAPPALYNILDELAASSAALQRAGLIRYKRGNVAIIDRLGLKQRSCECYGVSKREFDRLLDDRATRKVRSDRM